MLRRPMKRFGGGFKRKRFASRGGGRRFKRRFPARVPRPVLYKFAAPTARQKLTFVATYSQFSGHVGETAGINWSEPVAWSGNTQNNGRTGLYWAICANDAKDPADHGHYNQPLGGIGSTWEGKAGTGQLLDHTHRPFGWDEWMKLYRKCYVTGCKMSVEFHGAVAADAAGTTTFDGANVAITLAASDKAPPANNAAGYMNDITRGGVFAALGNQNMKMKMMKPKKQMINVAQSVKTYYWNSTDEKEVEKTTDNTNKAIVSSLQKIDGFVSLYKATKHILGLKTVYGDDNLSCNTDTNTVKRWSLNGFVIPATQADGMNGAGFVKGTGIIKCTFWCTFSSRRQVAQAVDNEAY